MLTQQGGKENYECKDLGFNCSGLQRRCQWRGGGLSLYDSTYASLTGPGRPIDTAATQLWSGTYAVRIFLVNTSTYRVKMRLNGTASNSDWDLYCDNASGMAPRYAITQVVDYNIITHTRYNGVISSIDLPKGTSLSVVTDMQIATIYYAIYKIV